MHRKVLKWLVKGLKKSVYNQNIWHWIMPLILCCLYLFICRLSSRIFQRSCQCPSLFRRSILRSKSSFMPASNSLNHCTAGWSDSLDVSIQADNRISVWIWLYCPVINHKFCDLSSTEIDDMLRKSTNLLLTRTLSSCLQNLIKKPHIGLTEVQTNTLMLPHVQRHRKLFTTIVVFLL